MNKYIIKSFAIFIPAIALMACSENSWNEKYLDGFKEGPSYSNPSTGEISLTTNDYNTISTVLSAVATTDEEKAAASAIKTNQYFDANSAFPAKIALPYYLASTSSEFFNFPNGSTVNISYSEISGTPEEISKISTASTYTVSAADYQEVWGSTSEYISAFSPEHPASSYIPNILKSKYPEAEEGQYAIVTYNTASDNPVFGDSGEVEITDAIKSLNLGDNLNAVAVVTAQSSVGIILSDKGGSIFYYNKSIDLSAFPIGSIVKVSGQVDAYNHGFQLTDAATISVVGQEEYDYPTPAVYNASMIDDACTISGNTLASYVAIGGELEVSGNYYNVNIPGATSVGSLYNPSSEIKSKLDNGKSYIFYGYFMAVSGSGKYFNLIVTDVEPMYTGELSDAIKNIDLNDELVATAIVTAQCSRGVILSDNAGSILYYNTKIDLSSYPIGTVVKASGTVSAYNRGFQLSDSATIEILGKSIYNYPAPTIYSAEMIDKACAESGNILASYVTIQGTMSISGTYYNIIIDGASAQGSIYYATDALKEKLVDGNNYIFNGYYIAVNGSTTKYFNIIVTDVSTPTLAVNYSDLLSRSALFTPSTVTENEAFYYNGSNWVTATDVAVLNPSDYAQMGDNNNSITSPAQKIPLYLKANYPYAVEGDIMYVAYNIGTNSCACGYFIYDGNSWSLNNNGFENLTAQFVKKDNSWTFSKYLGKAIFTFFDAEEIILDKTYMIAWGTAAATPVPTANSYGYLQKTEVAPADGVIVMSNDVNGFTFASTCEYNGNTYEAPQGWFIIRDSNSRYLYLQGTYSSFNVRADNPYIEDGKIADGYLFSATKNDDGSWSITNKYNERIIYYADNNYANFAAYTQPTESDHLPFLYMLSE